jgi:Kef-type K+ transport system membrane component KefB
MSVLLIILAAAAAGMGLARRLKLPLAPLLILSGVVVSALGWSTTRTCSRRRCSWGWPSWSSAPVPR